MLKTVGVVLAGAILAMILIAGGVFAAAYVIPRQLDAYFYFAFKALVGAAIGLLVGSLQKNKAGFVAVICLLPALLVQVTSRSYPIKTAPGFAMFLLSEILGLLAAFAVAHRLSKGKSGTARVAVPR